MTTVGARRLVLMAVAGWAVLVALGVVQYVVLGEEWTRGYLDVLALVTCVLLLWRFLR
jgi:hypothetical protein